jgi:MFS family permease
MCSALTAGTVQAADKELRGATMGLHSMCGYAGGFIGPLGVGLVLDWAGNADGWGLAFGHLALITLTGLFLLPASAQEAGCKPWLQLQASLQLKPVRLPLRPDGLVTAAPWATLPPELVELDDIRLEKRPSRCVSEFPILMN